MKEQIVDNIAPSSATSKWTLEFLIRCLTTLTCLSVKVKTHSNLFIKPKKLTNPKAQESEMALN